MAENLPTEGSSQGMPRARTESRFIGRRIIKTRFQLKFALVALITYAFAGGAVWLFGRIAVSNLLTSGAVTDPVAITQLGLLTGIISKTTMLGLAFTFAVALLFSHYIAGPLYRFEKVFEEMRRGNISMRVRLRKNDELRDLGDAFDHALLGLRNKIRLERETIDSSLDRIRSASERLREQGRGSEADEIAAALNAISERADRLKIKDDEN